MFFNIAVALWGWIAFFIGQTSDSHEALILWKISYPPILFIGIFFLHVIYELCNLSSYKILIFAYLQGILSSILSISTNLYISNTYLLFNTLHYAYTKSPVGVISFFIWLGLITYGVYQLIKSYLKFKGIKKLQILYFLIAITLGFSGGLSNFFPYLGFNFYPFGNFSIVIYCTIATYAILRYRLMDINIVIKRTAIYSLSAGLLVGFFIVVVLAMTKYLSNLAGVTSFAITAISALLIAFLLNPLRNRIQTVVDKIFYKKTYDYYSTIQKVSQGLTSIFDLKRIYSFIGDIIFSTLGLKSIYLLNADHVGSYQVVYTLGWDKSEEMKDKRAAKIDEDSQVAELLRISKDIIIKDELVEIKKIEQKTIDNVITDLKPFKGEAVVPVFIDDELELLMVLGEKLSEDMFSIEDIKLLNIISTQTAIAIKNAKLYTGKLRSEKLASIGMMSANFAHEIKNPLTSIKTFAQLLPERYSDIDFRENFSKIVIDSANRIDGLIKDLLDFSSGRTSVEMNTLNITGLIDKIIDEEKVNLELKGKKINIEKDYENINIDVLGDEKKLRQAFTNIILNGCQAINNRDDGILIVGINRNKDNVDISITDNGDGIPAEDVSRIFEPFFSTKTIGAGLGLAITKKIIEDHYGKIVVDSRFKKGTTFKISLPVTKME
jgi:signal transduction histidine kinase